VETVKDTVAQGTTSEVVVGEPPDLTLLGVMVRVQRQVDRLTEETEAQEPLCLALILFSTVTLEASGQFQVLTAGRVEP
jgi:hypothetical protein